MDSDSVTRRKILPVVGKDPAQVRMVGKVNPEHVPRLPLVPVGSLKSITVQFFLLIMFK